MTAELFESGIQTERSDVRAHVGPLARRVFVFKTVEGIKAIEKYSPPLGYAGQPGVNGCTAEGWKVRLEWIDGLVCIPCTTYDWSIFDRCRNTSEKGKAACDLVVALLERGRFPVFANASEDDRVSVQINGADIVIFAKQKIQVKCDMRAGLPQHHPDCTGNLFLQRKERNPLKLK